MRYIICVLLAILSGCAKTSEDSASSEPNILFRSDAPPGHSDNIWADPSSWGQALTSVDFSNKILFKNDARIHDVHKKAFPDLAERYVLWRMKHDGSCWVSASTTLLFFHMIESGPKKYDDILLHMRNLAQNYGKSTDIFNKEFFDIFELVKTNFSHKFVLNLRNHQVIYKKLDQGMRMLLAAYLQSQKPIDDHGKAKILKVQEPYSWGYADDFKGFFQSMKINYPVIDLWSGAWFISEASPEVTAKPAPQMLIIHSKNGFIDVLVVKEFLSSLNP